MDLRKKDYGTFACECGIRITKRKTGRTSHRKGIYHRHFKRIKALLAKNCLTYSEIGDRLGVTREMIRIIAGKTNQSLTGKERVASCTLNKRGLESRVKWQPIIAKCKEAGLYFSLVEVSNARGIWFSSQRCRINGHLCHRMRCCQSNGYFRIRRPSSRSKCEFVLYETPVGWYVIPRKGLPEATMFNPHPDTQRLTLTMRHDYQSFHEGWGLLKARRTQ